MLHPRFDLGIRQLIPDWRGMLARRQLLEDLWAGIAVACVALPLSLAIALASGVEPEIGLVTAIIGGIVCALMGGAPLAVSGPTPVMAVLVATIIQQFGFPGLIFIVFACGLLQLLTGILGLGNLIRFIPVPVVMGFTAGIGAIILIGQFPRVLGLPAPPESHIFSVVVHIKSLISQTNPAALLLALSTLIITMVMPKVWPKLPAPLFAVAIPSLVAHLLKVPVDIVGHIPAALPSPKLPSFPTESIAGVELISSAFMIYALASLETLLSARVVDQLAKTKPHDPNQELIGQGLGNVASALFGGIPIAAVIVRSALNIQAGAKTRRSAIFHALVLLAIVYCVAPIISQIPIAVLAGLLITIALRMCHPHEFLMLWHSARNDAVIYLVTFFMIVILGLISGIQVGIVAALIFAAIRLSQISINLYTSKFGPAQLALNGPLTFLSTGKLDNFEKTIEPNSLPNGLIIDLTKIKALDTTGAKHIAEVVDRLKNKNIKSALYIVNPDYVQVIKAVKPEIMSLVAHNELEMETILDLKDHHEQLTMDRLIYGIEKFKRTLNPKYKAIFSALAKNQQPHTLFITCCDSRIDPNLITSTQPGELFIVRNVGNMVPSFGVNSSVAEGAAIEYALGVLDVKQVIICAHSECGAINQTISGDIFKPENQKRFPSVVKWLNMLEEVKVHFTRHITSEEAAKLNASMQLENLKTYPIVQEKLKSDSLQLKAMYYDIGNADVAIWDEVLGQYISVGETEDKLIFGANQIRSVIQ
jgi:carbonic anhydrase